MSDIEFKDEFGAYLRAGGGDSGCLDADGKFNKTIQDPLVKFKCYVDIISRKLIVNDIKLEEKDINIMISQVDNLKYVNFKNPSAYILGYIASSGGSNISESNVTYCFNSVLPFVELEAGLQLPDVIRYARLWTNLVNSP